MEQVKLKLGTDKIDEALGIDPERMIDMDAHMDKVLLGLGKEQREDGIISSAEIFNMYISEAKTPQELAYLSYQAGKIIQRFTAVHEKIFGKNYDNKHLKAVGDIFQKIFTKEKV